MAEQETEDKDINELVWGHWRLASKDKILVIARNDLNRLDVHAAVTEYLYGNSWAGIAEPLDKQLPEEVRTELRWLIDDALDDAWWDVKWTPGGELPTRPEGWYPSDEDEVMEPFREEWLAGRPNPGDPEHYSLPTEIRALGATGFSMEGQTISFDLDRLTEIERVAEQLGLRLVHDDQAINACGPSS